MPTQKESVRVGLYIKIFCMTVTFNCFVLWNDAISTHFAPLCPLYSDDYMSRCETIRPVSHKGVEMCFGVAVFSSLHLLVNEEAEEDDAAAAAADVKGQLLII